MNTYFRSLSAAHGAYTFSFQLFERIRQKRIAQGRNRRMENKKKATRTTRPEHPAFRAELHRPTNGDQQCPTGRVPEWRTRRENQRYPGFDVSEARLRWGQQRTDTRVTHFIALAKLYGGYEVRGPTFKKPPLSRLTHQFRFPAIIPLRR